MCAHNLADLAQRFDADRRHLRSVAFQLLGSVADAEDAVQAAWLKASRADLGSISGIDNVTGWFTTIAAREALDQLRAPWRLPTKMRCWRIRSAARCSPS